MSLRKHGIGPSVVRVERDGALQETTRFTEGDITGNLIMHQEPDGMVRLSFVPGRKGTARQVKTI